MKFPVATFLTSSSFKVNITLALKSVLRDESFNSDKEKERGNNFPYFYNFCVVNTQIHFFSAYNYFKKKIFCLFPANPSPQ